MHPMIGILGAGRVGTARARQSLKAGDRVRIATARPATAIFTGSHSIPELRALVRHPLAA